jgi:hypothetical protein
MKWKSGSSRIKLAPIVDTRLKPAVERSLPEQLGKLVISEAGLLDDASHDVSWNVETSVIGNSDSAGFGRML